MDYITLKKLTKQYTNLVRYIYICNWLAYKEDLDHGQVSIYTNPFFKYVVTKGITFECRLPSSILKVFSNKDLAADFAWQLFGGEEEFQRLLKENKI